MSRQTLGAESNYLNDGPTDDAITEDIRQWLAEMLHHRKALANAHAQAVASQRQLEIALARFDELIEAAEARVSTDRSEEGGGQ